MIYLLKFKRNIYPALKLIKYTQCTKRHRARGSCRFNWRNSLQLSNSEPSVNSKGILRCLGRFSRNTKYFHILTVSYDDQALVIVKFLCKFNYDKDIAWINYIQWHNYSKRKTLVIWHNDIRWQLVASAKQSSFFSSVPGHDEYPQSHVRTGHRWPPHRPIVSKKQHKNFNCQKVI